MGTYFIDDEGNQVASEDGILSVLLQKEMKVEIHGKGVYRVVDWFYRHGQPDENPGLYIVIRLVPDESWYTPGNLTL